MLRKSALPPQGTLETIYPGDSILALKFHHLCHKRSWCLTHLHGVELSFPSAQEKLLQPLLPDQRCWTPCILLTLPRTCSLQGCSHCRLVERRCEMIVLTMIKDLMGLQVEQFQVYHHLWSGVELLCPSASEKWCALSSVQVSQLLITLF